MRLVYGLFDEPQDAHMVYPISAHAMDHQRDEDGGFVIEATTIQDPISFATTLEDENGALWGRPLVEAVRKFRRWVGVLAMVNDENNGTVSVDENGGEVFAAAFDEREKERLDAALSFSRDVLRAVAGDIRTTEAFVRGWMTASPIAVGPHMPLDLAGETMAEHGFHHLPVVENERLVGLVGLRDVTRSQRDASRLEVGLGF